MKLDKIDLIFIATLALLVGFLIVSITIELNNQQHCQERGGVPFKSKCWKKELFI